MGKPDWSQPQGIDTAGHPNKLATAVRDPRKAAASGEGSTDGAVPGVVGIASKSKSCHTAAMLSSSSTRSRWAFRQ